MPAPNVPAFMRVAADLRGQIENGTLPAGSQLPSMSQLREMYGVSNTVVRDALNELRRDGLTVGMQGKGVFVRKERGAAPAEDDLILTRLDELAATVRQMDLRLTQLEQAGAQEQKSQR